MFNSRDKPEERKQIRKLKSPTNKKPDEETKAEPVENIQEEYEQLQAQEKQRKEQIAFLRGKKAENERKVQRLREKNSKLQRDVLRAEEQSALNQYTQPSSRIPPELLALFSGHFGGHPDFGAFFEMFRPQTPSDMDYEQLLALQERIGFVSVGLNDEEINGIPIVSISASDQNCAICQSELGRRVKILPTCDHSYHAECIDQWLKQKRTCPICLAEIPRST